MSVPKPAKSPTVRCSLVRKHLSHSIESLRWIQVLGETPFIALVPRGLRWTNAGALSKAPESATRQKLLIFEFLTPKP